MSTSPIPLTHMSSSASLADVEVIQRPINQSYNQPINQPNNQSNNQSNDPNESRWSDNEDSSLLLQPTKGVERLDRFMMPESAYESAKRSIRRFYITQNEFLGSLKKLDSITSIQETDEEKPSRAAYLAIQISLCLTFVLLTLKMYTAVYSGSIAVIASSVDSILDVLSQGTLMITSRLMHKYDPVHYPAGKSKMEPVAILIFSCIMGMAAVFLLYVSITDLIEGIQNDGKDVVMNEVTITILAIVVVIQLIMYVYCKRVASLPIPGANAADALAQDHINDVCINLIGGIPAIVSGSISSAWIADPIGAICLSIYMAARWSQTAISQVPLLIGKTASAEFLNQLTYMAGTHDSRIVKVDTVTAYFSGIKYVVELHICLPEEMSLREAHDIGESLEQKIEKLEAVESAFVHLDFEWEHPAEHMARARAAGKEMRQSAPKSTLEAVIEVVDSIPAATLRATILAESNPSHEPITASHIVPGKGDIVHTFRH